MQDKKESSLVSDGIAAEDLGKFPDLNVAESLQRITGVSIDRSGGEGQAAGGDVALELLAGMLAPRQQAQSPALEGGRKGGGSAGSRSHRKSGKSRVGTGKS